MAAGGLLHQRPCAYLAAGPELATIKPTGWYVLRCSWLHKCAVKRHDPISWRPLACFGERGYDATSVAEICQRAGVSKGAFYYHFASKQALFVALLDQWLAVLDSRVAVEATTPLETLRAMVGLLQQVFDHARGRLTMYLEFRRQAVRDGRHLAGYHRAVRTLPRPAGWNDRAGHRQGSLWPC